MPNDLSSADALVIDVLQQFRTIYGSMRRYFREIEDRCGLPGSQAWILQEILRTPGIGVTDLSRRLGIHQSTSSQLVDRLVERGYVTKTRGRPDSRRVGLSLTPVGVDVLERFPGSTEGSLPAALRALPEVVLQTLHINISELIKHLPQRNNAFANILLAEILEQDADSKPQPGQRSAGIDLEDAVNAP